MSRSHACHEMTAHTLHVQAVHYEIGFGLMGVLVAQV